MPYKNIEDQRAYARKAAKRYAAKHPEKIKARRARWGAANRDYERGKAKERKENLKSAGLCTWCGINKTDGRVYCDSCRAKHKKSYLRLFENHPGWLDRRSKRILYGLSIEQYDAMRESQNHCCAICGKSENEIGERLNVDHDHLTGKVRELLCHCCNVRIRFVDGYHVLASSDKSWMPKGMEYLKKHEANFNECGLPGRKGKRGSKRVPDAPVVTER